MCNVAYFVCYLWNTVNPLFDDSGFSLLQYLYKEENVLCWIELLSIFKLLIKMRYLTLIGAICLATTSTVSALDRIIAYADSFTDNGNDYKHSGFPPSPPYWKGRFSNGPTWLEHVADALPDVKVINNGHGGATTDNAHAYSEFNGYVVPGTLQQAEQIEVNGTPDDLYIIYVGYNDLNAILNPDMYNVVKKNFTIEDVADGAVKTAEKLKEKYGAKEFCVMNVPPFYHWPVIQEGDKDKAKKLINDYNDLSKSKFEEIDGINVKFLDDNAFFEDLIANANKLGLSTDNGPCDPGIGKTNVCDDPTKHFYWDSYHPEAKAHKAFGEWALKNLKENYDF